MPWVPDALYSVLVEAARPVPPALPSPDVVTMPRDAFLALLALTRPEQKAAPTASPAPTEPAVELPRVVADAIDAFAFGDPLESAANYHRAIALHKAGRKPDEIVREIRMGAPLEAFV